MQISRIGYNNYKKTSANNKESNKKTNLENLSSSKEIAFNTKGLLGLGSLNRAIVNLSNSKNNISFKGTFVNNSEELQKIDADKIGSENEDIKIDDHISVKNIIGGYVEITGKENNFAQSGNITAQGCVNLTYANSGNIKSEKGKVNITGNRHNLAQVGNITTPKNVDLSYALSKDIKSEGRVILTDNSTANNINAKNVTLAYGSTAGNIDAQNKAYIYKSTAKDISAKCVTLANKSHINSVKAENYVEILDDKNIVNANITLTDSENPRVIIEDKDVNIDGNIIFPEYSNGKLFTPLDYPKDKLSELNGKIKNGEIEAGLINNSDLLKTIDSNIDQKYDINLEGNIKAQDINGKSVNINGILLPLTIYNDVYQINYLMPYPCTVGNITASNDIYLAMAKSEDIESKKGCVTIEGFKAKNDDPNAIQDSIEVKSKSGDITAQKDIVVQHATVGNIKSTDGIVTLKSPKNETKAQNVEGKEIVIQGSPEYRVSVGDITAKNKVDLARTISGDIRSEQGSVTIDGFESTAKSGDITAKNNITVQNATVGKIKSIDGDVTLKSQINSAKANNVEGRNVIINGNPQHAISTANVKAENKVELNNTNADIVKGEKVLLSGHSKVNAIFANNIVNVTSGSTVTDTVKAPEISIDSDSSVNSIIAKNKVELSESANITGNIELNDNKKPVVIINSNDVNIRGNIIFSEEKDTSKSKCFPSLKSPKGTVYIPKDYPKDKKQKLKAKIKNGKIKTLKANVGKIE